MPSKYPNVFGRKPMFPKHSRTEEKSKELLESSRLERSMTGVDADADATYDRSSRDGFKGEDVDKLVNWIDDIERRAKNILKEGQEQTESFYRSLRQQKEDEELKNRIFTDEFDRLEKLIQAQEEERKYSRIEGEEEEDEEEEEEEEEKEEEEEGVEEEEEGVEEEEEEVELDIIEIVDDEEIEVEKDVAESEEEDEIDFDDEEVEEYSDEEDENAEEEEHNEKETSTNHYSSNIPTHHPLDTIPAQDDIEEIEILDSEEEDEDEDEEVEEEEEDNEEEEEYEDEVDLTTDAVDSPSNSSSTFAYLTQGNQNVAYNIRGGRPRLIDHMPREDVFVDRDVHEDAEEDEDEDEKEDEDEEEDEEEDEDEDEIEEDGEEEDDDIEVIEDDGVDVDEQVQDDENFQSTIDSNQDVIGDEADEMAEDFEEDFEDEEEFEKDEGEYEKEEAQRNDVESMNFVDSLAEQHSSNFNPITLLASNQSLLDFAAAALGNSNEQQGGQNNHFAINESLIDISLIDYDTANETLQQEYSTLIEENEEPVEEAKQNEFTEAPSNEVSASTNVSEEYASELHSSAQIPTTELQQAQPATLIADAPPQIDIDTSQPPIFKTLPAEDPVEELAKLREIEEKFGVRLSSVPHDETENENDEIRRDAVDKDLQADFESFEEGKSEEKEENERFKEEVSQYADSDITVYMDADDNEEDTENIIIDREAEAEDPTIYKEAQTIVIEEENEVDVAPQDIFKEDPDNQDDSETEDHFKEERAIEDENTGESVIDIDVEDEESDKEETTQPVNTQSEEELVYVDADTGIETDGKTDFELYQRDEDKINEYDADEVDALNATHHRDVNFLPEVVEVKSVSPEAEKVPLPVDTNTPAELDTESDIKTSEANPSEVPLVVEPAEVEPSEVEPKYHEYVETIVEIDEAQVKHATGVKEPEEVVKTGEEPSVFGNLFVEIEDQTMPEVDAQPFEHPTVFEPELSNEEMIEIETEYHGIVIEATNVEEPKEQGKVGELHFPSTQTDVSIESIAPTPEIDDTLPYDEIDDTIVQSKTEICMVVGPSTVSRKRVAGDEAGGLKKKGRSIFSFLNPFTWNTRRKDQEVEVEQEEAPDAESESYNDLNANYSGEIFAEETIQTTTLHDETFSQVETESPIENKQYEEESKSEGDNVEYDEESAIEIEQPEAVDEGVCGEGIDAEEVLVKEVIDEDVIDEEVLAVDEEPEHIDIGLAKTAEVEDEQDENEENENENDNASERLGYEANDGTDMKGAVPVLDDVDSANIGLEEVDADAETDKLIQEDEHLKENGLSSDISDAVQEFEELPNDFQQNDTVDFEIDLQVDSTDIDESAQVAKVELEGVEEDIVSSDISDAVQEYEELAEDLQQNDTLDTDNVLEIDSADVIEKAEEAEEETTTEAANGDAIEVPEEANSDISDAVQEYEDLSEEEDLRVVSMPILNQIADSEVDTSKEPTPSAITDDSGAILEKKFMQIKSGSLGSFDLPFNNSDSEHEDENVAEEANEDGDQAQQIKVIEDLPRRRTRSSGRSRSVSPFKKVLGLDVVVSEIDLTLTRSLRNRDKTTSYYRSVSPRKTSGRKGRKKREASGEGDTNLDAIAAPLVRIEPPTLERIFTETESDEGVKVEIPESESTGTLAEDTTKTDILEAKIEDKKEEEEEEMQQDGKQPQDSYQDTPDSFQDQNSLLDTIPDLTPAHRTRSKSPLKRTLQQMLSKEAHIFPRRRKRRLLKKEDARGRTKSRE